MKKIKRAILSLACAGCLFGASLGTCFQQASDGCVFDWQTGDWNCSGNVPLSDLTGIDV